MSTNYSGYTNDVGTQNFQYEDMDYTNEEIDDGSNLNNPFVFIPWTIFAIFFVVGLVVTYNKIKSNRQVGAGHDGQVFEDTRHEDENDSAMTRSERRKWYEEKLKENNALVKLNDKDFITIQVGNDDNNLVASECGDGAESDDDLETGVEGSRINNGFWQITPSCGRTRTIGRCCAICLSNYQQGETVAVSASSECHHVFHLSCLIDTFAHTKGTKTNPCPICRREFVHPSSSFSLSGKDSS